MVRLVGVQILHLIVRERANPVGFGHKPVESFHDMMRIIPSIIPSKSRCSRPQVRERVVVEGIPEVTYEGDVASHSAQFFMVVEDLVKVTPYNPASIQNSVSCSNFIK